MTKEIGGYIELDTYHLPMLHEGAIALNCGRNALAYLFKTRQIKKIWLPYFICSSIPDICDREGIGREFYHVGTDFKPAEDIELRDDEWFYMVNYFGQLTNDDISDYVKRYQRVIVDQAQSYFQQPLDDIDTIYACRKYFGVADGAFLYTNKKLAENLPLDESFSRMNFLLGRYERPAGEFYAEYNANNKFFMNEPVKQMSRLTRNLLHGIDYDAVREIRKQNFQFLQERLGSKNRLAITETGTFMYPFMIKNGTVGKRKLIANHIFIPTLWPSVFEYCSYDDMEYQLAADILPLPVDQRYGIDDMDYIIGEIEKCLG